MDPASVSPAPLEASAEDPFLLLDEAFEFESAVESALLPVFVDDESSFVVDCFSVSDSLESDWLLELPVSDCSVVGVSLAVPKTASDTLDFSPMPLPSVTAKMMKAERAMAISPDAIATITTPRSVFARLARLILVARRAAVRALWDWAALRSMGGSAESRVSEDGIAPLSPWRTLVRCAS